MEARQEAAETRRGIIIMLSAVMFIALIDPSAKYAAQELPVLQVVWGRYAFALLAAIILFRPPLSPARWGVARLALQLVRALLLLSATAFNFLALRSLGLVENQAIVMFGPVVITALSILVFREKATPAVIAGLLAGLAGALLVIRPGGDIFKVGSLFAIGHVMSYAFYVLLSRRLLETDSALSLNMLAVFLPAAILSIFMPSIWVWPDTAGSWFAFASVGVAGGIGHFLLVLAHRHASASMLAPLAYTQLCWALAGGILVFREIPDLSTMIGAAVIVSSGLLVLMAGKR
ncbi:MAG: DMT family transporter [Shinella sp.]|nr:DMT family transporter [Shinella sp.]